MKNKSGNSIFSTRMSPLEKCFELYRRQIKARTVSRIFWTIIVTGFILGWICTPHILRWLYWYR